MSAYFRSSASQKARNNQADGTELEQGQRRPTPVADQPGAHPTVTVGKIGDFLEVDLRRVFVWARTGARLTLLLAVGGALLAGGYGLLSPRLYTVNSDVLIDPANLQVVNNDIYAQPGQVDGQILTVTNRLRIMTSGNVLSRVVDDLKLTEDPEFYRPPSDGLLSGILGHKNVKADPELAALSSLQKHVNAATSGSSFVATLSVTSQSTEKAIAISHAIVRIFQDELARAESDGAGRAAKALDDRLAQLKSSVQAADEKVETYKRRQNLSTGENGQLVSSLAITQLNTQLAAARSRVVDAQVSYNALLKVGADAVTGQPGVPTALSLLLDRAGGLQQQIEAQRVVFGDRHPSIVRMRAELSSVREQITAEIGRARNAAKSELDKANAAITQLQVRMKDLEGSAFNDNQSQVELRELQRDAASKSAIYESFLQRARQITEREQISTTNIQVISDPVPPAGRSWPPSTIVLIIAGGIGGLMLGLAIALARGLLADLRRPQQTETMAFAPAYVDPREPAPRSASSMEWTQSDAEAASTVTATAPSPGTRSAGPSRPAPAPGAPRPENPWTEDVRAEDIRARRPQPRSLLDY